MDIVWKMNINRKRSEIISELCEAARHSEVRAKHAAAIIKGRECHLNRC